MTDVPLYYSFAVPQQQLLLRTISYAQWVGYYPWCCLQSPRVNNNLVIYRSEAEGGIHSFCCIVNGRLHITYSACVHKHTHIHTLWNPEYDTDLQLADQSFSVLEAVQNIYFFVNILHTLN